MVVVVLLTEYVNLVVYYQKRSVLFSTIPFSYVLSSMGKYYQFNDNVFKVIYVYVYGHGQNHGYGHFCACACE